MVTFKNKDFLSFFTSLSENDQNFSPFKKISLLAIVQELLT